MRQVLADPAAAILQLLRRCMHLHHRTRLRGSPGHTISHSRFLTYPLPPPVTHAHTQSLCRRGEPHTISLGGGAVFNVGLVLNWANVNFPRYPRRGLFRALDSSSRKQECWVQAVVLRSLVLHPTSHAGFPSKLRQGDGVTAL